MLRACGIAGRAERERARLSLVSLLPPGPPARRPFPDCLWAEVHLSLTAGRPLWDNRGAHGQWRPVHLSISSACLTATARGLCAGRGGFCMAMPTCCLAVVARVGRWRFLVDKNASLQSTHGDARMRRRMSQRAAAAQVGIGE
uniref:Uncharacterized protein n=1 Tax=Plectus sambesii TaxID=2011161 RepID=A0A914VFV2_9BILA